MYKKITAIILAGLLTMSVCACGDTKVINGKRYDTYGLLNSDDKKNEQIEYEVVWGNVVWSVVLCQTIVAPIYFVGFSLFEPIGVKDNSKPKGVIQ